MFADSKANYDPSNVAPLIESFAGMLGKERTALKFQYAAGGELLEVTHPNDKSYLDGYLATHNAKSAALVQYETAAKKSVRLRAYQDTSPAGIEYFKD
jgi:hypothetical protein